MKFLIITDEDLNGYGGVANFSILLAERLHKLNKDIFFLSRGQLFQFKISSSYTYFTSNGNTSINLRLLREILSLNTSNCFIQYVPYSFSRFGTPFSLVFLAFFLKTIGLKVNIFFHEVAIRKNQKSIRLRLLAFLQLKIARILAMISHDSYTSNGLYKSLLKSQDIIIQPIPANIPFAKGGIYKQAETTIILSFVNRATDALYDAIDFIQFSGVNVRLVLIGYSIELHLERARYYQGIKNYPIDIIGVCDASIIADYYANADIYCQMELVNRNGEGGVSAKSGSLAAALQHGKVIITTKGDMTDDFMLQSDAFFFVDGNRPNDIADKLMYALKNKKEAKDKAIKAEYLYKTFFDWDIFEKVVLKAYVSDSIC